jgi:methyltransferase OMS1
MKFATIFKANISPRGGDAPLHHVNGIHVDRSILHNNAGNDTLPTTRRKLIVGIPTAVVGLPFLANSSTATPINSSLPPPPPVDRIDSQPSTSDIKESYNQYAENYDDLDGGAVADALGFPDQRKALLQEATGDVLECAVGTGLNFQYYNLTNVRSFTAIDLSPGMLKQAQLKSTSLRNPSISPAEKSYFTFQQADVTALPFPDNSFDAVVDTFSLCVFPDPAAALRSMARVVRPGGKVLLLEHSKSQNPLLGWYQDVTANQVAAMGKGCVWNQNVINLIENAGLRIERVDRYVGDLVLSITARKL